MQMRKDIVTNNGIHINADQSTKYESVQTENGSTHSEKSSADQGRPKQSAQNESIEKRNREVGSSEPEQDNTETETERKARGNKPDRESDILTWSSWSSNLVQGIKHTLPPLKYHRYKQQSNKAKNYEEIPKARMQMKTKNNEENSRLHKQKTNTDKRKSTSVEIKNTPGMKLEELQNKILKEQQSSDSEDIMHITYQVLKTPKKSRIPNDLDILNEMGKMNIFNAKEIDSDIQEEVDEKANISPFYLVKPIKEKIFIVDTQPIHNIAQNKRHLKKFNRHDYLIKTLDSEFEIWDENNVKEIIFKKQDGVSSEYDQKGKSKERYRAPGDNDQSHKRKNYYVELLREGVAQGRKPVDTPKESREHDYLIKNLDREFKILNENNLKEIIYKKSESSESYQKEQSKELYRDLGDEDQINERRNHYVELQREGAAQVRNPIDIPIESGELNDDSQKYIIYQRIHNPIGEKALEVKLPAKYTAPLPAQERRPIKESNMHGHSNDILEKLYRIGYEIKPVKYALKKPTSPALQQLKQIKQLKHRLHRDSNSNAIDDQHENIIRIFT